MFTVHRLVATAFIPNDNNLPFVNHKDENRQNNNVDNLEWCTPKYNVTYGTARQRASDKLCGVPRTEEVKKKISKNHHNVSGGSNPRARKVICINTGEVFPTIKDAAKWCGKKGTTSIRKCCRGLQETCGTHPETGEPLKWAYLQ